MTRSETAKYWGAVFVAFVLFLWAFGGILGPFLFGAAIAYLADPVVDQFERIGLSRTLSTLLVTAMAFIIAIVILLLLLPPLIEQLQTLISNAPGYFGRLRGWMETHISVLVPAVAQENGGWFSEQNGELSPEARKWGLNALKGVLSGGVALVDFLAVAFITPVVAFYLLLDWDRIISAINDALPLQYADTVRGLARDIDSVLSGFLRGQLAVCLILGSFYAVALTIIGLDFGLLIGIFAGLISFIPFLGSMIGLLLSVGLAFAQFWGEWWIIGGVAAVFVTGQLIEGNVLTPLLVGGSTGLHPVWLMFALSAFGYLFGFAGLLVAVPVAAALGVLARWGLRQYTDSALYYGSRK